MPSNIGICFVCLSNDPKDTYIQSNADNDVYIYIHMFYIMPSYILCAFRAPISCKYIYIYIFLKNALIFCGSDVVFLCAVCTYFELKKQLKS